VYGEDYAQLSRLASQVRGLLSTVNGLGPAEVRLPAQEPSIQVAVDNAAALHAGVLPGDARRQASTLVSGLTVGNFFEDQAVFDVVVLGVQSVRSTVAQVQSLLIDTAGGGNVRLGSVASVDVGSGPIDIEHEALSRYVDVTAPVYVGGVGAAGTAIQHKLPQISFPLDYHAEVVGGTPDSPTSHLEFLSFVLAAAVGVLLLLQASIGSWRLAALFLLALPASLIGGIIVGLATGEAGSLGAAAGLLAVFALATRQGLVQIAHIRRRHAESGGELTAELVVNAARERLAPSLTALLVIASTLAPFVVMGDVAGNEITHAAAAVILGGLVTTTLLIQLLVPAICLALGPTEAIAGEPIDDLADSPAVPVPSASAT
jgi:Cu/Ag efflux pump CusA